MWTRGHRNGARMEKGILVSVSDPDRYFDIDHNRNVEEINKNKII